MLLVYDLIPETTIRPGKVTTPQQIMGAPGNGLKFDYKRDGTYMLSVYNMDIGAATISIKAVDANHSDLVLGPVPSNSYLYIGALESAKYKHQDGCVYLECDRTDVQYEVHHISHF